MICELGQSKPTKYNMNKSDFQCFTNITVTNSLQWTPRQKESVGTLNLDWSEGTSIYVTNFPYYFAHPSAVQRHWVDVGLVTRHRNTWNTNKPQGLLMMFYYRVMESR